MSETSRDLFTPIVPADGDPMPRPNIDGVLGAINDFAEQHNVAAPEAEVPAPAPVTDSEARHDPVTAPVTPTPGRHARKEAPAWPDFADSDDEEPVITANPATEAPKGTTQLPKEEAHQEQPGLSKEDREWLRALTPEIVDNLPDGGIDWIDESWDRKDLIPEDAYRRFLDRAEERYNARQKAAEASKPEAQTPPLSEVRYKPLGEITPGDVANMSDGDFEDLGLPANLAELSPEAYAAYRARESSNADLGEERVARGGLFSRLRSRKGKHDESGDEPPKRRRFRKDKEAPVAVDGFDANGDPLPVPADNANELTDEFTENDMALLRRMLAEDGPEPEPADRPGWWARTRARVSSGSNLATFNALNAAGTGQRKMAEFAHNKLSVPDPRPEDPNHRKFTKAGLAVLAGAAAVGLALVVLRGDAPSGSGAHTAGALEHAGHGSFSGGLDLDQIPGHADTGGVIDNPGIDTIPDPKTGLPAETGAPGADTLPDQSNLPGHAELGPDGQPVPSEAVPPPSDILEEGNNTWDYSRDVLKHYGYSASNAQTDVLKDYLLEQTGFTEDTAHLMPAGMHMPVPDPDKLAELIGNTK